MAAVLTLSMGAEALAADPQAGAVQGNTTSASTEGVTCFDFGASDYYTKENAGTFHVSIVRHGSDLRAVDVLFRAADFLGHYGTDYTILDGDGKELPLKDGVTVNLSDITANSDYDFDKAAPKETTAGVVENGQGTDSAEETSEQAAETTVEDTAKQAEETAAENTEKQAEEAVPEDTAKQAAETVPEDTTAQTAGTDPAAAAPEKDTAEKTEEPAAAEAAEATAEQKPAAVTNTDKQNASTGSSLRDAQAAFLGIDNPEGQQAAENTKNVVDELDNFFEKARGAEGTVHFNEGEMKQEITIRLIDNDQPNADKAFMLALTATSDEAMSIAANATTYVAIADDEAAEKQTFTLSGTAVLTSDQPKATLTVTRTSGSEYFGTAYVSTVQETAAQSTYNAFESAKLSFLPGETAKTFEVSAVGFSENASFGVRLEADGETKRSSDYVSVQIRADVPKSSADVKAGRSTATAVRLQTASQPETAVTVTLGQEKTTFRWNDIGYNRVCGDLSRGEGSGWWATDDYPQWWTNLVCYENRHPAGKGFYSTNKINFTGTVKLEEDWQQEGTHSGGHGDYYMFADIVSEGSQNRWGQGYVRSCTRSDNFTGGRYAIYTGSLMDSYYIRVGVENLGNYACDNAKGYFGNPFTLTWRKYSFSSVDSKQVIYVGDTYTLTDDDPKGYTVAHNGPTYNAGGIEMVDENGSTVTAFYANAGKTVTARALKAEENRKNGIVLDSVKLYVKGNEKNAVDMKGTSFTLNQDLIRKLSAGGDDDISVITLCAMPVWRQEKVSVLFYNTDTVGGIFSDSSKGSCVEGSTKFTKAKRNDFFDYKKPGSSEFYYTSFPKCAWLSMNMTTAGSRVANGFQVSILKTFGESSTLEYQKAVYDAATGKTIPARKDQLLYQVMQDCAISPLTKEQTMTIRYYPDTEIPDVYKTATLKGVITDTRSGYGNASSEKDGTLVLSNIYSGSTFSFQAIAPQGYYTQWVNMTGDANGDGFIDTNEKVTPSQNPREVNGSELTGTVDHSGSVRSGLLL